MMGGEFLSVTINNTGTFFLQCWIPKEDLFLVLFVTFQFGFLELQ